MLTPDEHARVDAFEMWLRSDIEPEQLQLDLCHTSIRRPQIEEVRHIHPGDRHGLESMGSILRRWLDDLYAKQAA